MEDPHAGVIRDETEADCASGRNLNRVATDRVLLSLDQGRVLRRVLGRVVGDPLNNLEFVAVKMAEQKSETRYEEGIWRKRTRGAFQHRRF
jgi:hypothetical protein